MGNTNCPVCGTSIKLQTKFCPTCGFERHIFPNGVSGEVQAYENERLAKAKEVYEAANAKAAADKEMQSKLDEANKALEDEKKAHEETKSALENEKTDHEETKSDLENEKTAHERTKSNLEDALKDEEAAHKETKSNLAKEQTAHKKTKTDLENEKTAHERTKSNLEDALKDEEEAHKRTKAKLVNEQVAHMQTKKELDDAKKNPPTSPPPVSTPTPRPNKKVIGKALFTQGGRSETVALYEGVCRVTAPAWTNVKGELFEIKPINDIYILRDLIGNMCDRNNRRVSSKGVPASHGDCFTIGELVIRLTLPEFL